MKMDSSKKQTTHHCDDIELLKMELDTENRNRYVLYNIILLRSEIIQFNHFNIYPAIKISISHLKNFLGAWHNQNIWI